MKTKTKTYLLGLLLLIFQVPVMAQTTDALNKPNVKIKVNIKKDAQGNIISYDSSYVSTWSSSGNNKSTNVDSLLNVFGFNKNMTNSFFEPDSLMDNLFITEQQDSLYNNPKKILKEFKRIEQMYGLDSFFPKNKKYLSTINL